MPKTKVNESCPRWIMIVTNLVSLLIYATGGYIIYQLGAVWLAIFVFYVFWLEIRVMKYSCINCYYYGKSCAFGKGKISPLFFKKGSREAFINREITWMSILPDFLVSLVPMIVGIVLIIMHFDWHILVAVVLLFLLTSVGNVFVRGSLACKYCGQRELGCPAERMFNKKK